MSSDVKGGLDYALMKRHYDNDDYVALSFTATQQGYVVGTMAYLADTTVATSQPGWTIVTPTPPVPLVLVALGLTSGLGFEAKDLLFYATQDCYIRFQEPNRVQHFIPANTYMRFHRRCLVFYVVRSTADGVLRCYLEG